MIIPMVYPFSSIFHVGQCRLPVVSSPVPFSHQRSELSSNFASQNWATMWNILIPDLLSIPKKKSFKVPVDSLHSLAKRPEILTKVGYLQSVPWWKNHTAIPPFFRSYRPGGLLENSRFFWSQQAKKTSIDSVCSHGFPIVSEMFFHRLPW